MDDWRGVLAREFAAEEGSFHIQLHVDLTWDKEGFTRLIDAMMACCQQLDRTETVETWMAQGFWYLPGYVRDWAGNPSLPREHAEDYYQKACQRLDELAYWFFMGESLYLPGHVYEPL